MHLANWTADLPGDVNLMGRVDKRNASSMRHVKFPWIPRADHEISEVPRIEHRHPPVLGFPDELRDGLNGRVIRMGMAIYEHHAVSTNRFNDGIAFLNGSRHRLLDDDMFAILRSHRCVFGVKVVRGADVYDVDVAALAHRLHGRKGLAPEVAHETLDCMRSEICRCGDPHAGVLGDLGQRQRAGKPKSGYADS
jgi:hypothetical protein